MHRHRVGRVHRHGQVKITVAVEVTGLRRRHARARRVGHECREGAIVVAAQDPDGAGEEVCRGKVGVAVQIEVADRHGELPIAGKVGPAKRTADGPFVEVGVSTIWVILKYEDLPACSGGRTNRSTPGRSSCFTVRQIRT